MFIQAGTNGNQRNPSRSCCNHIRSPRDQSGFWTSPRQCWWTWWTAGFRSTL